MCRMCVCDLCRMCVIRVCRMYAYVREQRYGWIVRFILTHDCTLYPRNRPLPRETSSFVTSIDASIAKTGFILVTCHLTM
jgi:hypothetical protein